MFFICFDVFGLELHTKLFLEGENQIQMLHGIPILDRLRRRFRRDLICLSSEDVAGDLPHLL